MTWCRLKWVFFFVVATVLAATGAYAINIDTVPVGNPGNAADTTGYGAVGYDYDIGTYEVTGAQYAQFLNAVAATDPYGLYNTHMGAGDWACKIQRSGTSGSYTYSVADDWANRPVNLVSWYDAARFCNWLTNRRHGVGSLYVQRRHYRYGHPGPRDGRANSRQNGVVHSDGGRSGIRPRITRTTARPGTTSTIPPAATPFRATA